MELLLRRNETYAPGGAHLDVDADSEEEKEGIDRELEFVRQERFSPARGSGSAAVALSSIQSDVESKTDPYLSFPDTCTNESISEVAQAQDAVPFRENKDRGYDNEAYHYHDSDSADHCLADASDSFNTSLSPHEQNCFDAMST